MVDGILHQLSLLLALCHLCETMRTKGVLHALGTLLCARALWVAVAVPAWENVIGVMSDVKPGMRIL